MVGDEENDDAARIRGKTQYFLNGEEISHGE